MSSAVMRAQVISMSWGWSSWVLSGGVVWVWVWRVAAVSGVGMVGSLVCWWVRVRAAVMVASARDGSPWGVWS